MVLIFVFLRLKDEIDLGFGDFGYFGEVAEIIGFFALVFGDVGKRFW